MFMHYFPSLHHKQITLLTQCLYTSIITMTDIGMFMGIRHYDMAIYTLVLTIRYNFCFMTAIYNFCIISHKNCMDMCSQILCIARPSVPVCTIVMRTGCEWRINILFCLCNKCTLIHKCYNNHCCQNTKYYCLGNFTIPYSTLPSIPSSTK